MRFHADSIFGPGLRRPLNRDARRIWTARARIHRRHRRLTACHHDVAEALARRLGQDGRLDPSHDTLAADAACSARTVRRALARLRDLGMLAWQRRLVRTDGWRAEQTSSAYVLLLGEAPNVRTSGAKSAELSRQGSDLGACGGQGGRGTTFDHVLTHDPARPAALAALAAVRQAMAGRLATRANRF